MDSDKHIITTQALLAIEVANQALSGHDAAAGAAQDLEQSTCKLRAHYAQTRGLCPPEVTLELLRRRHAQRQQPPPA
jgi:hypothetical protein